MAGLLDLHRTRCLLKGLPAWMRTCCRAPLPPAAKGRTPGPGAYGLATPSQMLLKTGSAAAAAAGKALFPVLDSLANSVIGDNPALLEEIRCDENTAILVADLYRYQGNRLLTVGEVVTTK